MRVAQLLRALQHKLLKQHFSNGMDLEEESVGSTNSALQAQNLSRLSQLQVDEQDVVEVDAPPTYRRGQQPQVSQSVLSSEEREAQIARPLVSRRQRSIEELLSVEFSEEDLLSLQQDDTSSILEVDEPGVFPGWALEFLKFYYKV